MGSCSLKDFIFADFLVWKDIRTFCYIWCVCSSSNQWNDFLLFIKTKVKICHHNTQPFMFLSPKKKKENSYIDYKRKPNSALSRWSILILPLPYQRKHRKNPPPPQKKKKTCEGVFDFEILVEPKLVNLECGSIHEAEQKTTHVTVEGVIICFCFL